MIVETMNGYHVVAKSDVDQRDKALQLAQDLRVNTFVGNPRTMCPVPGTYQGGFPVKLLETRPVLA